MGFDYRKIGLKRIDTYIIKKFLGTYFYSIVLILSIAVVFDLTEKWIIFSIITHRLKL
jgi:lipopolysaccharide export system permease protein